MNHPTVEQDARRLELALRENVSGKPQLLEYDTRSGNMTVAPVRGGQNAESQFGVLNRNAMTQFFGGADELATSIVPHTTLDGRRDSVTTYSYDCDTGEMVETTACPAEAPSLRGNSVEGQFGTLMGDSFLSTFGCDVTVATVCESALDLVGNDCGHGFGYTLEDEGVVRIVRGGADPLAKGRRDEVVFTNGGETDEQYGDARYIVRLDGKGGATVFEKNEGGGRKVPRVAIIPDGPGMYALGTGLLETSSLKDARAMLLGCGSMGCDVAMHLAMAGVGEIILVDPDRVEASNLGRLRDAVIADVGRRKVDVLEERIRGKNPSCKVVKVGEDITIKPDRMAAILAEADIAVVSTDNRASRVLFARALQRAGKPCIYTRCSTRAESGDCFISRPGQACNECLYGIFSAGTDEVDDFSSAKKAGRLASYCTPEDMGSFKILPGISTDISSITAFASRLAIWELANVKGDDQFAQFSEEFSRFNYFLFVNRREKFFKNEAWGPFDKAAQQQLPCPQRWYGALIARRADCSCCGNQADEIDDGASDAMAFAEMSADR